VPRFARRVRVARAVRAAFDRALAALGVGVDEIELDGLEHVTFLGGLTGAHETATGPFAGRTRTAMGRAGLALGRALAEGDVARLVRQREALRRAALHALERSPILAMPTTAIPPLALTPDLLAGRTSVVALRALGAFTPLANLVDLPSIAVPCGSDDRGRPLSIMFVAAPGEETALLGIAHAVEDTGLGERPVET
jgi:Asp-tRNA(Asn)/Glu-tRNA(Gln) amidotransferase A subunit family amidase